MRRALVPLLCLAACGGGGEGSRVDAALADGGPVGDASPATDAAPDAAAGPDAAPSPRYNEVFRVVTHNSYWVKRDNVVEAFASGTQERLLDQLLVEHARGLELDVHRDDTTPHNFTVYHTDKQSNSLCSPLAECLEMLRAFHRALPEHEAVNLVIELKEYEQDDFDATHTPADLDATFDLLADAGGSWLYRPRDLLLRCPGAASLRECVRTRGWPTTRELRGKFIVSVIGNWREDLTLDACRAILPASSCSVQPTDIIKGHGPAGWVSYATWGGGVGERAGFPMRSNWVRFNQGPDTDTVAPADLAAANDASVIWQVEDLADPAVPGFLAEGGIVRGRDSFSHADQDARVAAGFQLIQTDYPWWKSVEDGPTRPFHPFAAGLPPAAFVEPGLRLMLAGSADDTRLAFAAHAEPPDRCTTWESLPSTTRPSPDAAYPATQRPRGQGCLRAAADPADADADSVTLCRTVVDGEYARLSVTTRGFGTTSTVSVDSAANTAAGVGDLLQLRVCSAGSATTVTASSAGEIAAGGDPVWVVVAQKTLPSLLVHQGLAGTRDVLFVGTHRDGAPVRGGDLDAPVVTRAAGQAALGDATLDDLSAP